MNTYNNFFDFQMWLMLQYRFMPYYIIGKQDEWKQWAGLSLNGWKSYSICK